MPSIPIPGVEPAIDRVKVLIDARKANIHIGSQVAESLVNLLERLSTHRPNCTMEIVSELLSKGIQDDHSRDRDLV